MPHHMSSFLLLNPWQLQLGPLLYELLQVALIAVVEEEVEVVLCFKSAVQLYDVLMAQRSEDVRLFLYFS